MKLKLTKLIILAIVSAFSFGAITSTTYADDICNNKNVSEEVRAAAGCKGSGNVATLPTVITNILYAIIAVAGLVAVVFIIIGGFHYMTSNGDAAKTQKAKKIFLNF